MKMKLAFRLCSFFLMLTTFAHPSPAAERDGTLVLLSPSEIADLRQWVENAKQELTLLQDDTLRGTLEQRRKMIIQEFEAIVNRSSKKENELLTRYTLNRALEIDELVGDSPAPSELQSLVSFLDSTIVLAKSFYTDDQKYLEAIGRREKPDLQLPMAVFAHQYAENLLEFSRTFVRPSLEYQITYKALGWLANDLNSERNLLRIQFAESITRIARLQSRYTAEAAGNDAELLESIRKFKWEYRERVLQHVLEVNTEISEAIKRAEAKRREDERLAKLSEEERAREAARTAAEKKWAEENRLFLEKLEGSHKENAKYYASILKFHPESGEIFGRVFRSSTSGRIMEFTLQNGKLAAKYRHQNYYSVSTSVELFDGEFLLSMTRDNARWSVFPSGKDCILFDFKSGKDTLCDSSKLDVRTKSSQLGVYLSKKTARYFIIKNVNGKTEITYNHARIYGPAYANFQSPNQIKYSHDGNQSEYLLEWIDENCLKFSWGWAESDVLCRNRAVQVVPHGIYRSGSGREMIFRHAADASVTVDYNHTPGQRDVIVENGVGFIRDFHWGFEIESASCLSIYWGYGDKDRLCKTNRDKE